MMMVSTRLVLAGCLALSFITMAQAQDAPGAEPSADTVEDSGRPKLEEIIVTAQKRAENVQDVPISMTAISGEVLKDNNIENLNDLSLYTPNVKIQSIAPFGRINMRGLGSGSNRGFEQSVGLILDGVFFARLQYLTDAMLDIERVEALRGPQGTLFGKNTIAGAMNIAFGTPEESFRAEADAAIGQFKQRRFRGMATGPITSDDALKFRIAAVYDQKDGHTDNTFLGRDELNTDNQALRAKLAWDSDFGLSIVAGVTYAQFEQRSWGIQFTKLDADTRLTYGLFDDGLEDDVGNYEGQADYPGQNERETWTAIVQADQDIGELTLTSVTGYSTFEEVGGIDADGGPMPFITLLGTEKYTQISQEVRLASAPGDFQWQIGLYYFYSKVDVQTGVDILPIADPGSLIATTLAPMALADLLGPALSGLLGPLGQPDGLENARLRFDQTQHSYAVFGQADWAITPELTLIWGGRFSYEKKSVDQEQVLNGAGIITMGVAEWEEYTNVDERTEISFAPKVSLTYHWTDDVMSYVTLAQGFKGGGYNASASTNAELEYNEENAVTYELGLKTTFLGGAARANIGGFYTIFRDLQVSVFSTTQFVVRNAADAVTRGIEFDFMVMPLEGLFVMASGAWTDAYFTSFPQGTCQNGVDQDFCDLSGKRLQRAPEWTANASVNYVNPLFNLPFDLVMGVDILFQDDFFLAVDQDPLEQQKAYTQFNARIGFRADDDSWSIMVFGRNLTDEVVLVTAADAPLADGSHIGAVEPPRSFSIEATVRF